MEILRKRKNTDATLSIRAPKEMIESLGRVAIQHECSKCEIVRFGIKKALEILDKKDSTDMVEETPT